MNFKEDKLAAENAAQYETNLATYRNWLTKHVEVRDCIANRKMFEEYLDWSDEFTEADLDFALGNLTSRLQLAMQRVPTVAEENARRRAMSIPQLQQLARQERQVPQPDSLPQFYVPIGKKKEVELTAEVLRRAGSRTGEISTADLKFLIRRWTAAEVNKRLGVKPTIQPGYSKALEI